MKGLINNEMIALITIDICTISNGQFHRNLRDKIRIFSALRTCSDDSRTILRQHFIATRFCRNIVHFAHDIATVLYSKKRPDPNLNKYPSNFYPLTPNFLSPYPNPYRNPYPNIYPNPYPNIYPNPCITHALNHTLRPKPCITHTETQTLAHAQTIP